MRVPHHARPALIGAATSTALVIFMTSSSLTYLAGAGAGCASTGCGTPPPAPDTVPPTAAAQPATPVTMPVTPVPTDAVGVR